MKNQLKRIIGETVILATSDITQTYSLNKSKEALIEVPLQIITEHYNLYIYNKVDLKGTTKLTDIINKRILGIESNKLREVIRFENDCSLIINLDDESFSGTEAMVLYGPKNLIVVWN